METIYKGCHSGIFYRILKEKTDTNPIYYAQYAKEDTKSDKMKWQQVDGKKWQTFASAGDAIMIHAYKHGEK